MKERTFKLLLAFCYIIFICSTIVFCSYFIVENINSCTREPLEYYIKDVENNIDTTLAYAYGDITIISTDGRSFTEEFGNKPNQYINFD